MNKIWIIAKRELKGFFDSLMAYILLILFLGLSGLFTWVVGNNIFTMGQASLHYFFGIAYWSLFFFIPMLTMRMLAEEKRSGTLEFLLTKPINDWQLVMGKFLGTLLLIVIALALTIPYYITIAQIGPADHGAIISGYLGLILMSAAYIGIGIFASSVTSNQIVAVLLSMFIGIFFHFVFDMLAYSFSGVLGETLSFLSITTHYDSISRGVIDSRDIIYFLSIAFAGLIGAEAALGKRNLAD